MDSVQRFISENQHQFGYIMQEASRQWVEKDSVGALTVGDCNFVVEKHGQYHEILEKMQKLSAFYDYFHELYGQGLEVANWHGNGDLEHFDNFFESAEQEME